MLQKLKSLVHQHKHIQLAHVSTRAFTKGAKDEEFSLEQVTKRSKNAAKKAPQKKRDRQTIEEMEHEAEDMTLLSSSLEGPAAELWRKQEAQINQRVKEFQKRASAKEEATSEEEIDVEQYFRKHYPKEVHKLEEKLKQLKLTPEQVEGFEQQAEEILEKTGEEFIAKHFKDSNEHVEYLPGQEFFEPEFMQSIEHLPEHVQEERIEKVLEKGDFDIKDIGNPYWAHYKQYGPAVNSIVEEEELTEDVDNRGRKQYIPRRKSSKPYPSLTAQLEEPEVSREQGDLYEKIQNELLKGTKEQLAQYQLTNHLLSLLEDSLKGDKDGKAYLEAKLKASKSNYNQVILKSLRDRKNTAAYIDQSIQRSVDEDQRQEVVDSFTVGARQLQHPDGYKPANDFDVSEYQRNRNFLSAQEYLDLQNQHETKPEEKWREYYDIPDGLFLDPQEFPDYKVDQNGKLRINVSSQEQMDQLRHIEYKYQLLQQGIDLDKYNNDYISMQRDMIRQQNGSVSSNQGHQFDQPSLDMPRDLHFELGQQLSSSDAPTFDNDAMKRTQAWMKLQFCEDPTLERQKMNMRYQDEAVVSPELKQRINEEFIEYQRLHEQNCDQREKIAFDFKAIRDLWKQVQNDRLELIQEVKAKLDAEVGRNEVNQRGALDRFLQEEGLAENRWRAKRLEELRNEAWIPFDGTGNALACEQELLRISKQATVMKQKEPLLHRYEFVFEHMRRNNIKMNSDSRARMFEYAVYNKQNQLANRMLQRLIQDGVGGAPILPEVLARFFVHALRTDNLDGVAYLSEYCRRNEVDITNWDLSAFRASLNHYMNVDFDLSKLLTFTKFHTQFYAQRAQRVFGSLPNDQVDDASISAASQSIFSEHDALVDLSHLFTFLSEQIGNERVIDPITKEDCMWQLVDMYTRDPLFFRASQQSQNQKIGPEQLASYLSLQFEQGNALRRVMTVALRMDESGEGEKFTHALLKELRSYQTKNGSLPFSQKQVSELYYKMRAQGFKDKPSAELVLYLLTQVNCAAEVADLCDKLPSTNVTQYYMSEALLSTAQPDFQSAVKLAIPDSSSVCAVTQRTKALMLDGKTQDAVQFFQEEVARIRSQNKSRKSMLVDFYNSVFDKDLSFEEFKATHARASLRAQSLAKEVFAVQQLAGIIKNKDFEQIENLFTFYTLLKEQRHLESNRHRFEGLEAEYENRLGQCLERQEQLMAQLGDSELFVKMLDLDRVFQLDEVKSLASAGQNERNALLELFKGITIGEIEGMNDLKKPSDASMRLDQYVAFLREKQAKYAEHGTETEDQTDLESIEAMPEGKAKNNALRSFEYNQKRRLAQKAKEQDLDERLKAAEEELAESRKKNFWTEIPENYRGIEKDLYLLKPDLKATIDNSPERELYDPNDPQAQKDLIHFWHDSVSDIVQQYTDANHRNLGRPSERMLQEADNALWDINFAKRIDKRAHKFPNAKKRVHRLKMKAIEKELVEDYNHKIDDLNDPVMLLHTVYDESMLAMKEDLLAAIKARKSNALSLAFSIFAKIQNQKFKLQSLEVSQDFEKAENNVQQELETLKHLVDDARSPIVSLLVDTEKYHLPIPESAEAYYASEEDYLNPIDIDRCKFEGEKLQDAQGYCQAITDKLMLVKKKIFEERLKLAQGKEFRPISQQFEQRQDEMLQILYQEYRNQGGNFGGMSEEEKQAFMQKTLSVHGRFQATDFPAFYALDLVTFGLNKNLPEAIRLGEQVLQQEGHKMPKNLQRAVRDYLLTSQNGQRYRASMKVTGLQDTSAIYAANANSDYSKHAIFSKNDDKWMEWMAKNSRKQDQYRTPSAWAFDHKPYGLAGEVVDVNAYKQKLAKLDQFM